VLILAARIDSRRQSTNGVIATGDLFVRVSRDDPDYRNLIARYEPTDEELARYAAEHPVDTDIEGEEGVQ
jgi:hypothetical protein